jgi:iron complex transport system substrate-binding protein
MLMEMSGFFLRYTCVLALAGWGTFAAEASVRAWQAKSGWEVEDAWGRRVVAPFTAKRVVSLSPAVTSMVYELGLQEHLAGVTRFCRVPEGQKTPPRLGGGDASLEAILGVKPDLVLAGTLITEEDCRRLEAAGIPVVVFRQQTFGDIFEDAAVVGKLLGGGEENLKRVERARERLRRISLGSEWQGRKALVLFSEQGDVWTSGPGSYGDETLRALGLQNIAAALGSPWGQLSREFILQQGPEILIYSGNGPKEGVRVERLRLEAKWKNDPFWGKLPAVRKSRLVVVPDGLLEVPSLRMVEAAEWIAEALRAPEF